MWHIVRRFREDREGTIAFTFAVAMLPVMMLISAGVDLSRMAAQQSRLQSAVDAAALVAARGIAEGRITDANLQAEIQKIVSANINPTEMANVTVQATRNNYEISVTANGTIIPLASGLANRNTWNITRQTTALWAGQSKRIDLVMVLDNTGSMASAGKMAALKEAAKNLIAQMQTASAYVPGAIRIGIVPFDTQVRIGTTYRDEFWLRYSGSTTRDNWNGCTRDRTQPYDTDDTTPTTADTTTMFDARMCTGTLTTILPLTNDWAALNTKVDEMNPSGNTNITIGLAWGFHMLSRSEPLTSVRTLLEEPQLQRIIILLTDGDNTQNRWTTNGNSIDARTSLACTNIKNNGILLYTIRVINGDATLLRNCATTNGMFYDARTAQDVIPAFQAIAGQITNLRLTR